MDSTGLAISAVTVLVMEAIVLVSTRNGFGGLYKLPSKRSLKLLKVKKPYN